MLQAIIVDDEKKCIVLLEKLLEQMQEQVKIVGTFTNPEDAVMYIKQHEPDLVFLDIEMPKLNGFEVVEATREIGYDVVFTTAFNQYAINAIRVSALDYLLKPINKLELFNAVNKLITKKKNEQRQQQFDFLFNSLKSTNQLNNKITIATTEGVVFIEVADILYCEANGSYTTLYLRNNDKLLSSKTLKDFEEMLEQHPFFRIHHSYLISLNDIKRYIKGDGGTVVLSNKIELPVSKRKKDDFLKKLKL